MLEFRDSPGFVTFKVIYTEEGCVIGELIHRRKLWVFWPSPRVPFYCGSYVEQIADKLKELNEKILEN